MGRSKDWSKIEEIIRKIKDHGLSYREGAKQYGISVHALYAYNKQIKKKQIKKKSSQEVSSPSVSSLTSLPSDQGNDEITGSCPIPNIPSEIEQIIVSYRTNHPDHGYRKIQDHLKDTYFIVSEFQS
jgi:hypothetical protein